MAAMVPLGLRLHHSVFALFIILSIPAAFSVNSLRANELLPGPHIAEVNILLPPKMTHPVEYQLQGSGGCFKWSWDHHDILSVLPEYNETNHCSTSARLRSIAPYTGRKETAVFATDVQTRMVVRCKVFIDMFSRIQISHSSIKLDLDGLATLRVRAFDHEENEFSSLVGLQFMWKLMPEIDGSTHNLLHVPLKDSPLSDCSGFCGDMNIQTKLENSGVYSDLFVVRGTGIGREVVSLSLVESGFGSMEDKIVLTIAEAMSLDPPSPVFVLIGSGLNYNLKVIRGSVPQVVTLPSQFHRWSVLNSSVAEVNPTMGLVHALSLGETKVIVEDTRVSGHVQLSSLHVVLPDYLNLYLLAVYKTGDPVEAAISIPSAACWYIVSGHQYLVEMKAFSRGPNVHEIYLTANEELQLNYDQTEHWKSLPVPESITFKYGWRNARILDATSPGLGKLSASLSYYSEHSKTKEVLQLVQEVMVCDEVKINMHRQASAYPSIVLPWAPGIYQEVELKATGGCVEEFTDYKWVSSDTDIVSVSAAGIIHAKRPGKATIKVSSTYDMLNFDKVVVEVSVPSSIVMMRNFPTETVVGSHIHAAVTMKASNGDFFYRCDAFSTAIRWNTRSESFTTVNSTSPTSLISKLENADPNSSVPCAWTDIHAASVGRTVLHATLSKDYRQLDNSFGGPSTLKASVAIASYLPLTVHQAGDGSQFGGYWFDSSNMGLYNLLEELHLVPGTHIDVQLRGGPEKWGGDVDFIEHVDVINEKKDIARDIDVAYKIPDNLGNLYRISCLNMGNSTLIFKRGNLDGDDHPLPVVEKVPLRVTCSFPSSIVVLVDESVNTLEVIKSSIQADRGSDHVQSVPISVANGRTIRISAVGISHSGKAFANSSSLPISWELITCDGLASLDDSYSNKLSISSWERFLVLQNTSGLCTVRAVVHDFQPGPNRVLEDGVRLQLVSVLRVFPSFNLLYYHPDAKMNLSVVGGSCFLDATVNDSQVVELVQPRAGVCSQLTLIPRGLGTSIVTVYDMGLTPPLTDTSVVQVADVDWIKLVQDDELSIMMGGSQSIELLAGVDAGHTFAPSQYIHMNVRAHIKDHIVDLGDDSAGEHTGVGHISASNLKLYGRHLGVTTLYVSARRQDGEEVVSKPIKVEVYAPPILHPNDLFLVPGASFVLSLRGGPTFSVTVKYAIMDDNTATIHNSLGRLFAISPGNTTVAATFYGPENVAICQAFGQVVVGIPSSMILNLQSKQLSNGRETHVFPLLSEGDLFSFYALCNNYRWAIKNEKVLSFSEARYLTSTQYVSSQSGQKDAESAGYADQYSSDFIRVLHARSAGTTTVALTFSCHFTSGAFSRRMSYESTVSVKVVPELPLALGSPITWVLPPHYTTSDLLPLSSESDIKGDSQGQMSSITYSVMADHKSSVSIDGSKIRTSGSNSLACLQAKDHTTRITEVAACLRIAEVAQIRIAKELVSHVLDLAVGSEHDLHLNYYDYLGIPFREAYDVVPFNIDTNYPNIVTVNCNHHGNGSVSIKAIHHGQALLRVQLGDDAQKSDYILISVGAHMYPQNPMLFPGSPANFSVKGVDKQSSGYWLSTNGSVLSVDSLSGKAQAVREGTTKVVYRNSNFTLQTTVTVLKGSDISIVAPKDTLTNAPFPTSGYYFSVKLSDNKLGFPKRNAEVAFDCRVDPPFIGYVKPWRDLDTGDTYCVFSPHSPEHLAHTLPRSRDWGAATTISVHASLVEANNVTGYASASFVGGFSILGFNKDFLQLNLTRMSNQSVIALVGNTDVHVDWHDKTRLLVSRVDEQQEVGNGRSAHYEIKMLSADSKPFKDVITFNLPANGQRLEVDVMYEPTSGDDLKSRASSYYVMLWLAFMALLVAILSFWASRPDKGAGGGSPQQSGGSTTTTPVRSRSAPSTQVDQGSAGSWDDQSPPKTPPAFMEYLRRTIDETPYYNRRDATRRRSYNPQNTY